MKQLRPAKSHTKKPAGDIKIKSFGRDSVLNKWDSHFKKEILKAFKGAKFVETSGVSTAKDVAENTLFAVRHFEDHDHLVAV